MNGFVGMETSGQIRRRLEALGHKVFSCDLLPADDEETIRHLQMDVFEALDYLWATNQWPTFSVWHPDCTYLTSSAEWAYKDPDFERYPGVGYHQRLKPGTLFGEARRKERERSIEQFHRIRQEPIRVKIVENPVGVLSREFKPNIVIQPYMCGDDASKATCLWAFDKNGEQIEDFPFVKNPDLYIPPTLRPNGKRYWGNQTDNGQNRLSPGKDRWKDRSETYDGIADFVVESIERYFGI